ncbi:MAG: L,D-transpeptidase family protein [Thioalkalivibrio sp.]|nr:L,D-transpeptidase family protein [Thioalkalivibrio sp.]
MGRGAVLHRGEQDQRVPALRRRLDQLVVDDADSLLYDPVLGAAVHGFQLRHGLAPDEVVGRRTIAALDVEAVARAHQLALTLDRLSLLPQDRGSRYVLVNVAASTLAMVVDDSVHGVMKAIVGRRDRPTPTIMSSITQIELNPYWNIPESLARRDVLPHLREDPEYWRKQDIRVFANWENDAAELDPALIDWAAIEPEDLVYKLRQEPGPLNPLGRIKFLFDNDHSVYIHDTPSRSRFDARSRYFSSGCVRIEDPDALTEFLLQGAEAPLRARIAAARRGDDPKRFDLPHPVPVYLVYWTAWVDGDGVVHFRDDVYGRDGAAPVVTTGP